MRLPSHNHSIRKLASVNNSLQQFQLQFQLHSVARRIFLHQIMRIRNKVKLNSRYAFIGTLCIKGLTHSFG